MTPAAIVAQVLAEMQAVMDHPTALAGNVPLGRWRDALAALAVSPSVQPQELYPLGCDRCDASVARKCFHEGCMRYDRHDDRKKPHPASSPAVTGRPSELQKRRYAQLAEYIAVSLCQPRRARQVELILDGWFSARAEAHAAPAEAPQEQPVDSTGQGRLMLNAYGRQCWEAGYHAAKSACPHCNAEAPSEEQA